MKFYINLAINTLIVSSAVLGTPLASSYKSVSETTGPTQPSLTLAKLNQALAPCGNPNSAALGENISCSEALPHIQAALSAYGLTSAQQIAFYLSIVSVESGNLSFNRNHFPGRPGQGTRSMMMPQNLYAFLKDTPSIVSSNDVLTQVINQPYDDTNSQAKEQVLNVLVSDQYSFLPGAWWIAKGAGLVQNPSCSTLADSLSSSSPEAVSNLFTQCVGVNGGDRIQNYQAILSIIQS